VAQASSVTVTPSSVGANATTTVRISGSGFNPEDDVALTNCPETNPGAVYPVPFPNPGPGRNTGRVVFINSRTLLVSTPSVIPEGVCDIRIGDVTVPDALTFVEAPPRLDIEIRNTSGRPARTAKRTTYTVTGTAADGTTATARIRLRIVR